MLCAVEMDDDLPLEHVHRLVRVGMGVQWRQLAPLQLHLEQQERAAGLFGRRLPRVHPAAVEPASLATLPGPYQRRRRAANGHDVCSLSAPRRYVAPGLRGTAVPRWDASTVSPRVKRVRGKWSHRPEAANPDGAPRRRPG